LSYTIRFERPAAIHTRSRAAIQKKPFNYADISIMTNKARVVRFAAAGAPQVLALETIDLADPAAGEVQVRQRAIGLNYMDVYHRSGLYPLPLPSGVGTEAAGVVERVGAGVKEFKPGDRVVYGSGAPGAYADLRNMPADRLIAIPEGIRDDEAAAILMKGMTVEYLLNRCYPLKAGEFALMYAAAGGVGLLAGQWGRHIGARMIGVASGADKCQRARDNGYEFVIDRSKEDVVARVKEITGGAGVPVVYDSVGKITFENSLKCLAPRGILASFGESSGDPPLISARTLGNLGSLFVTHPSLIDYTATRADFQETANDLFAMVGSGKIKIKITREYPLGDVAIAHADVEARRTTGSVVLIP
jgi:NADPH2:quinone reductase